jgi:hypothetical protein
MGRERVKIAPKRGVNNWGDRALNVEWVLLSALSRANPRLESIDAQAQSVYSIP